jgi:hypothetical protein
MWPLAVESNYDVYASDNSHRRACDQRQPLRAKRPWRSVGQAPRWFVVLKTIVPVSQNALPSSIRPISEAQSERKAADAARRPYPSGEGGQMRYLCRIRFAGEPGAT